MRIANRLRKLEAAYAPRIRARMKVPGEVLRVVCCDPIAKGLVRQCRELLEDARKRDPQVEAAARRDSREMLQLLDVPTLRKWRDLALALKQRLEQLKQKSAQPCEVSA